MAPIEPAFRASEAVGWVRIVRKPFWNARLRWFMRASVVCPCGREALDGRAARFGSVLRPWSYNRPLWSDGMNVPSDGPVLRLLDANANRAREALRVVEDYARFVLDDGDL